MLPAYMGMVHEKSGTIARDHFRDVFGMAGLGNPNGKPGGRASWWDPNLYFPISHTYTSPSNGVTYESVSELAHSLQTSFVFQFAWLCNKDAVF